MSKMSFFEYYHYVWYELADPRTNDTFLLSTPWPLLTIILLYLYSVLYVGPNFMKNRKPYSLKYFMRGYNVYQIFSNAWMVYTLLGTGWTTGESTIFCHEIQFSDSSRLNKIANLLWWTLILKLSDLIETGIFVLRKKERQVSFLHLYHHVTSLLIVLLATKWLSGVMASFYVILNSSVHVIMYTYYFISTLDLGISKYLQKIKPMITIVQMIQFAIMIAHNLVLFNPSCYAYKVPAIIMFTNVMVNFVLFYNFYQQNYKKLKRQ